MKTGVATSLVLVLLWGIGTPLCGEDFPELQRQLRRRCGECHGGEDAIEANLNLAAIESQDELASRPELLDDLMAALRDRRMPAPGGPPLDDSERADMIARLKRILDEALRTYPLVPTPIRRMNRFQYNNAVVDLLELDRDIFQLDERLLRRRDEYFHPETRKMPPEVRVSCRPLSKDIDNERPEGFRGVAAFPQDQRAEHGFDNRADHLTLSPLLMESFLQLSQSIVESPDLNAQECRSWHWLFAPPDAIRLRLARLLRRAFRRPVDTETLDRFTKFAEQQIAAGASIEETMRTVVSAVLAMPEFLYFYESFNDPPPQPASGGENDALDEQRHTADVGGALDSPAGSAVGPLGRERIDDFELASRLALFFWCSIPDDRLLDLAEARKLSEPQTLSAEIDRMLNDRKSSRFCDNFPGQWLQLDRLITSIPDREQFQYFYYHGYRTSMHMMSEPLLLFETVYVEDRSILDLLAPDFTWESEMLRQNYDGQSKSDHEVQVQRFRRVPLTDPRRGGVITNAAIMTMTSTPTRTQPITRGAWLNEVIFNDPPQPPPADVPPLPEVDKEELAKLTIRERLAVHRQRADCAACHDRIDPLGFALENYGPTGVWRDKYENGREVDPGGSLFHQHEFKTLVEFKALLLQERQRFIRAFAAHLLSYALGRETGPADWPALDGILSQAMAGQDQMRTILKGVAMSDSFLHKCRPRTQETATHE